MIDLKELKERDYVVIFEGWPHERIETERFVKMSIEERDALVRLAELTKREVRLNGGASIQMTDALDEFEFED